MSRPPPKNPNLTDFALFPGERPAAAEAVEVNSATAWAEFEQLQALQDGHVPFQEPTIPGPLPQGAFTTTEPGATPGSGASAPFTGAPGGAPSMTLEKALIEVRRFNRVCPKPEHWQRLYELLLSAAAEDSSRSQPPPPLTGRAWEGTSAMPKRICLRDQLEWAAPYGALPQIMAFLMSLPETQWHHMGD